MEPLPIFIKKFWTEYKPELRRVEETDRNGKKIERFEPTGELREVDWVAYSPLGSLQKTVNTEAISRLSALVPMEGRAVQNPAVQMAHMRWNAIKPQYEAWKAGRTAPLSGTPLAAWNGITPEQAEIMRMHGLHTVEDVSRLTDTHRQRIGLPGLNDLIDNAKRFLTTMDKSVVTRALEEKDAQIASLQAQMAELIEMVKEANKPAEQVAPRRGRPPKVAQPPAPEAAA